MIIGLDSKDVPVGGRQFAEGVQHAISDKKGLVVYFSLPWVLLISKRLYKAGSCAEVTPNPRHRGGARETFFPS
jgi:hypothetical protein